MKRLLIPVLGLCLTFTVHAATGTTSFLDQAGELGPAAGSDPGSRSWVQTSPVPGGHTAVRYAHAQDPDNPDSFYIISGLDNGSETQNVFRYDSGTDTWNTLTSIPVGEEGPAATCFNGRIYVAGGGGSTHFQIYTIATDSWSAGPDVPRGSWGTAMGAWNGKIFVIGGDSDFILGDTSDSVDIYDISSLTWSSGTAMPFAACTAGYVQSGQYLYIVGGWGDDTPANNVTATQRYDMSADTWSIGPTFGSARGDLALTISGETLYAMGGDANGGGVFDPSDTVEYLDLAYWPGGTWIDTIDPIPTGITALRCGATTSAVTGREIWLVGGIDPGFTFLGTTQYKQVPPPSNWVKTASMAAGAGVVRYAHAQDPGNPDSIYIFSGVDESYSITSNAWRYDAGTDMWSLLAPIPVPHEGTTAAFYNGNMYVAGGSGTTDFQIYDTLTNSWSAGTAVPRGFWGAAMGAWDGRVFVIGGDSDFLFGDVSDSVDIYNVASSTWSTGTAMPVPVSAAGYVQSGRYLYIVGGWGDDSPTNNVKETQRYDMAADTWSSGPEFTSGRGDFALTISEEILYAIGGDADGGGGFDYSAIVEYLDLSTWPGGVWTDLEEPLPNGHCSVRCGAFTSAVTGAEIWLIGGYTSGGIIGTTQYLEIPVPPTNTPVPSTPTPTPECTELGCNVVMPRNYYTEGDECYCDVIICNPNPETYSSTPVFVILDVYGTYFFAPSFGEFDHYTEDVASGEMTIHVLPSFPWPADVGSASDLVWYAAMTDQTITSLFGGLGTFTFGWGM